MSLSSVKSLITLFSTAALLAACGGSLVGSAPPPVGGLTLEPGEGGVTLSWTAVPGVVYWAYTGQSATLCKNCNNANDWYGNGVVGAQSRGWATAITSPYFFTGNTLQTNLNNDAVYAFIMDGRTNGKPAGDATPSVSTTPRLNGANWYNGGTIGTGAIKGMAFGPVLNNTVTNNYDTTGTYLAFGDGGIKYKSADGLNWSLITTVTDTTNWKAAAYAFTGSTIQKFVGVGAGGAVIYSSDLVTWTPAPTALTVSAGQDLNDVTSSSNMLVAVGNKGTILRSTDGLNWVAASSVPSTPNLYAVKYTTVLVLGVVTPLWVAVGDGGAVLYSSDAATWIVANSGTTQDLKGVASVVNYNYPNGVYIPTNSALATVSYSVVAVGKGGTVIQTGDGINWTPQTLGTGSHLNAIVASTAMLPTNQFMIVGDGGKAFTSPDGVTWTPRTPTTTQGLTGLIRGLNNQYLAWAANGTTTYSK